MEVEPTLRAKRSDSAGIVVRRRLNRGACRVDYVEEVLSCWFLVLSCGRSAAGFRWGLVLGAVDRAEERGGPGVLAEAAELAFSDEVDLDVVDDDARVALALGVFKAPEFFAVFVGDGEGRVASGEGQGRVGAMERKSGFGKRWRKQVSPFRLHGRARF